MLTYLLNLLLCLLCGWIRTRSNRSCSRYLSSWARCWFSSPNISAFFLANPLDRCDNTCVWQIRPLIQATGFLTRPLNPTTHLVTIAETSRYFPPGAISLVRLVLLFVHLRKLHKTGFLTTTYLNPT